mmetsp:Transcript_43249/g.97558  ORF Transcript_43249/g.97558 Transcript_43249/m.97558 type:complete len:522 (+) Transcript_43249:141-1706(+)
MAVPHKNIVGILKKHGYTEVKKIGQGSFGQAILVHGQDGAQLICKMVDVSQASPRETQDAVKEGKLLAAFKHPYVVRYRESFLESGWLCIIMDYCEGGDLSQQIEQAKKKRSQIPEEQILRWMTQALLAIKYIHEKHVLHRDLKSGNFFLSKSGNLKMGDFGIAKVLSCTAACAKTQIGTPYYLSPEVCQEKPYGWPSDIWATGCILYELCALKVPFDAPNISGLVQKICRGPTPQLPPSYSDFLRELCTDMLNRKPENRPSAESILQRPRMQAVVRQMLDQAHAAQGSGALASEGGNSRPLLEAEAIPAAIPPPPFPGAYAEASGCYRKGDLVEYHSSTHKDWLPAVVVGVDGDGRIVIDLKPNTWISREAQASQVRPRRRESGTPMRHGSPCREQSSPCWLGRPLPSPGRAGTPGAFVREITPHGFAGGLGPGRPNREPSPGPGGHIGSRAGSRASTPSSRVEGAAGAYRDPARRYSEGSEQPQVLPPGLPRAPPGNSPNFAPRPCRMAGAAGLVIAGV